MRATALLIILWGLPAQAHIGHLGEVAGHGHLIGAGLIGIAIAIGLLGAKKDPEEEAEPDEAAAEEEQPA